MPPKPASPAADRDASDSDESSAAPETDDNTFTTYVFSERGTTLPYYVLETDVAVEGKNSEAPSSEEEEINLFQHHVRGKQDRLPSLTKAQRSQKLSSEELQKVFKGYRARIITNTLETYVLFLSWASHISRIDDEPERIKQEEALQEFIRDAEHISDKASKGSLSAVGQRIIVASYIWLHGNVFDWWNEQRGRVSVKMIASCAVKVISDPFLLGRLFRLLMQNEHNSKAEVSQLAKQVADEDGIAAWNIITGDASAERGPHGRELEFHVFHSDDWVDGDDVELAAALKHATHRRWVKATTLQQHEHWTDLCEEQDKAIRALTIVSIGTVAKKAGGMDTYEVMFSNKDVLWLSHDDIRGMNIKKWTQALDAADEQSAEEKKDEEKKDAPRTSGSSSQQKLIEMEEKLKEEHRLRIEEHELRVQAEKKLQLLQQEREKERAEQQRRQRMQQRDRARETAQLLDRLSELSARVSDNKLREEVLQLVRELRGKGVQEPAEECKVAPQRSAAAEAKENSESPPASQEVAESDDDAAEGPPEEDSAEDEAPEEDGAEDEAPEQDASAASTSPLPTGGKRKATAKAKPGKQQRR